MTENTSVKHKNINLRFADADLWAWLTPLLLIIPNVILGFTETYPLPMRVANVVLPLGVWLLVMGIWKRMGVTMLCLLPVMVLCAFQIVLIFLYGESIIAIDMFLNVVTTNASEVGELLGNLRTAMITVFVLYLPPIVASVMLVCKHGFATRRTLRRLRLSGAAVTAAGVILLAVAWIFVDASRPARQMFPYNVSSNIFSAAERTDQSIHYPETSADFSYHAVATRPDSVPEVYVFVIGETARADNWSLFGYDRPTTPRLRNRDGLIGFTHTLSEVNTTHKSVPMLMSCLDSRTFGDSVNYVRSIFEAFNGAGFNTAYISNQHRNHSYIDYFGEEAKSGKFLTDTGSPRPDLDLTGHFSAFVDANRGDKLFVVLHTYGSHFEYNKRYPADMAVFTPDTNSDAGRTNRGQLINAYDNTIHYTDSLLSCLISTLDSLDVPSALMYVSDHGEDIYDDARGRFLHASPVPTYWQLHVPMIMWMSAELRAAHPEMWNAALDNRDRDASSSRSIFHTMLQLAGLRTPWLDPSASLVSPRYIPARHTYLNDYNESVPLALSGLREPDFIELRKHGFTVD